MLKPLQVNQIRRALRVDEFAAQCGVSTGWVYMRIRDGSLPATRLGGVYLISVENVEKILQGDTEYSDD